MKIKQIDHFVITTRSLAESLHFYVDILGMEHEEKDGHHSLKFGLQKINLHLTKGEFQPAALKPEYGAQDFCLIVDEDMAAVKKEIEQKQWPILEGIVKRNGAQGSMQSLYLRDPDGNLVELSSYGHHSGDITSNRKP
jgi:catechol 2,3-dioxygenase-like lactoylglutathione lyase family enzyme